MLYIKTPTYTRNSLKDLYLWFAKLLNIKTSYADLELAALNNIQTIFSAKNNDLVKPLLKGRRQSKWHEGNTHLLYNSGLG